MYRRVSVLLPTRKRVESLERTLKTYDATVTEPSSAEIVLRCDSDDPETIEYLRGRPHRFIVGPRNDGYGSLPRFFNEMAGVATGDVLLCCNDDVEFRTPDWPSLVLEAAGRYPDGIFNIGVNVGLNDDKFPFSIVSRRLVQALGFINDERLLFSDVFLLDVARSFGRAIRLESVTVFHDWAGHRDDATRRDANRHEFATVFKDETGAWTEAYRDKHDAAVTEAVQKISHASGSRSAIAMRSLDTYEGIHYARTEVAQVLEEIFRHGINSGQALVTSLGNGLASQLWLQVFPHVISINRDVAMAPPVGPDHHTVLTGDVGQTRFLYEVLDHVRHLHALIIDDLRYASAMSTYYLLGSSIERPGIIVFLPMAPDRAGEAGVRRLVTDLRSGVADNRRHVITDVVPEVGGPGMSYELLL